jgi:hypothetical protein
VNQKPLLNVDCLSQVGLPHPTRFVQVSKATFHQIRPDSLQFLNPDEQVWAEEKAKGIGRRSIVSSRLMFSTLLGLLRSLQR